MGLFKDQKDFFKIPEFWRSKIEKSELSGASSGRPDRIDNKNEYLNPSVPYWFICVGSRCRQIDELRSLRRDCTRL